MLNLILGGAGCGKSYEMTNRIEAAAKAGKNVLIIIPDQFSAEFDRSLYERLGMVLFNRLDVLSFDRTARDVFIRHGGLKGRYADDTVKKVMMYRALAEISERDGLLFYGRQAKSPSFAESSLEIVKELTVNGITAEVLSACADRLDESVRDKTADIALIYSEYCRILSQSGYKDSGGDVSEAAARAAKHGYFAGKTVYIDAFKSFTADEYAMLNVMIAQSESVTVCLPTADAQSAEYSVFAAVNRTVSKLTGAAADLGVKTVKTMLTEPKRFKAPELAFYSANVLRNVRGRFGGENRAVKVYRSADSYGEGDLVCSEIRRLVMEEGFRYSDIAVLARQKELYSSVMESAFERYGIPFYTDDSRTAAHKSLFIFVRTALALAAGKSASTEDWLRYMKTGMAGLTDEEIAAVEDCCYKWNIEGGMWEKPFEYDDVRFGAEQVRKKVTEPIFKLRRAMADSDGKGFCAALVTFFDDAGLYGSLQSFCENCTSEDAAALAAVREIKQLWELLCGLLETLDRALADAKISPADFAELFSAAASGLKLSSPPQTLDCVQFVAAHTARLAEPKAVFVIGANEGAFPYAAKPSGLFSDRDRLALEAAGITLSGGSADKLDEERFAAYSALSMASERLWITYPVSDISGRQLYPSSVVNHAEEIFGKDVATSFEQRGLLPFCTTARAAYYQYVRNYRRGDADSASLRKALEELPEYAERLEYLKNIENSAEHSLSPETGRRLFGRNISMSASRFEDYMKCPFKYYCQKGLKLYPPQKVELDSPSRGTAIHYCLSETLREKSRDEFIAMSREDILKLVKKHLGEYYRSDAVGGDYGKTKRYKAAFARLSDTLADILERLAEEFGQSKFVPEGFEYTLRRDGDEDPLKLVTESGITVWFEGTVDRVDVYRGDAETYVRVIDYKSGVKEFRYEDLLYGVNMQMLLYLFAVTDGNSRGRFSGDVPAGVLYMPAKDAAAGLGRNDGEEALREVLNGTYKMKGAVLRNDDVITAMEKDCGGVFIPVKKTSGGYYAYSKLVTAEQLENLRKYSYRLLEETAENLAKGKVEALPLADGEGALPCGYCDYKSVCGNYPPDRFREYAGNAYELIEKIMNGDDTQ
ncbi:MAG: PD-(D/E)XK nuclease family protein [Prevotella sp.]|nr:PD-(D/E)XK nuclease family protein [Prevotella sp.]